MALSDYEETIKSFIHDDDKLVTYQWLSKELEVHVNVAKDLLKKYWEKYEKEEKIVATYLLIGVLEDGSIRVEVVKESNLSTAKAKFAKVNCEHIYSVQKCLEDIQLLAFAGDGDIRYSAIKCKEEYIRNDEEIESLRYVGNVKKEENKSIASDKGNTKIPEKEIKKQVDSVKEKPKNEEKKTNIKEKKTVDEKDSHKESKRDSKRESETKSNISNGTATKKISPPSKSNKLTKKPIQSKQSGFNNLFGKVANKPQVNNKSKDTSNDSNTEDVDKEEEAAKSVEKEDKPVKEKEESKISTNEKNLKKQEKENKTQQLNNKSKDTPKNIKTDTSKDTSKSNARSKTRVKENTNNKGKKRNLSQEKAPASKRKRILVVDSSEDESNKSDNDAEEEEPMDVEEQPKPVKARSPSPPKEKRENGKRMIRKTVDECYKDDNGYLVTRRVHKYIPADDEEIEEVKPEVKAEVKKKELKKKQEVADTKAKKKQTTLTSFFKKS